MIPDEGGMKWADTMLWVTPSNKGPQVAAWMNYFYDLVNAARLANDIGYISPVAGIEEEITKLDPAAVDNPLLFPPADVQERLHAFGALSAKDEEKFDRRFAEISGA